MRRSSPILLADVSAGRDNNFDVLRLVAATMVLFSHAFPLTGSKEPLAALGGPTLGGLGVALFFAMSGFLITLSWMRQPHAKTFMRKRAIRILPGLWVATALTTFVLGAAVSTLSLMDYYTHPQVWTYFTRCLAVITFDGRLPGLFETVPFPYAVNGSLWTLPLELLAYGMVLVVGVLGLFSRKAVVVALFAASLVALFALRTTIIVEPIALFAYFLAGMTIAIYRDRIRLSWPIMLVGVAVWIWSFGTPVLSVVGAIALPYAAMVLAYRTPIRIGAVCRFGDVSYGMYIYAFPVQQTLMEINPGMGPVANAFIATPIVWLLGLASWRLIERPALKYKVRSNAAIDRIVASGDIKAAR